jgi:phage-related baseplate assembly protein
MGAKEFMEVAKTLAPKIKACTDVAGFERVMAQEVLQAVSRSVMVNGAQQHGLKQVKLKAALKVYSILAAERDTEHRAGTSSSQCFGNYCLRSDS